MKKIKITEEQLKRLRENESEPLTKYEVKILELLHSKGADEGSVLWYLKEKLGFDEEEAVQIATLFVLNARPEGGYSELVDVERELDPELFDEYRYALFKFLQDEGEDILSPLQLKETDWSNYSLRVFEWEDEPSEYAIGTEDEVDFAMGEYADSVVYEWEVYFSPENLLEMDAIEFDSAIVQDVVDSMLDGMDTEELAEEAGMLDEYESIEEYYDDLIDGADDDEVDDLEAEKENKLEELADEAREKAHENMVDDHEYYFEQDPLDYLYNYIGSDKEELVRHYGEIDEGAVRDEIINHWEIGNCLSGYDGAHHTFVLNGEEYSIFRIG